MSIWLRKKKEDGSGGTDILLLPLVELMLPSVLLIGMLITIGPRGALLLSCLGFIFFLAAKVSLLVDGIYISWGSKSMSRSFRASYRLGYGLMIVGFLATFFSLRIGR